MAAGAFLGLTWGGDLLKFNRREWALLRPQSGGCGMDRAKSPPVLALAGTGSVSAKIEVNGVEARESARSRRRGRVPRPKFIPRKKVFVKSVPSTPRRSGGGFFSLDSFRGAMLAC